MSKSSIISNAGKIRNYFGSSITRNFVSPNFIEIQKRSYDNFLYNREPNDDDIADDSMIWSSLQSIFPITDHGGKYMLECLGYRIDEPKFNTEECRIKSLTYSAPLYLSLRLITFDIDEETGERDVQTIKDQDILLCNIPLMTDNATFIINGVERVIVSQMHRSPGVFFVKDYEQNIPTCSAKIIPYRGSWIDFEFSDKGVFYFKIDSKKKIPIAVLLLCMGYEPERIISTFYDTFSLNLAKAKKDFVPLEYFDASTVKGRRINFNIYDENGEILSQKDSFVTSAIVKSLSGKSLFVKLHDFDGAVLAKNIILPEDKLPAQKKGKSEEEGADQSAQNAFTAGEVLNLTQLEYLKECDVTEVSLINTNHKNYSNYIVNSIVSIKSKTHQEAIQELFEIMHSDEPFVYENAENYFNALFFNAATYSLSSVGRYKINLSLGLNPEESKELCLTHNDIIKILQRLIELKGNEEISDDIDHLGNRRVRSVGELLDNNLRSGLYKMLRSAQEKFNFIDVSTASPSDLITPNAVVSAIREFFMTDQLSQFTEQTNPLAELAHKRRISSLGTGGLSRNRATFKVRDVHPSHYGRICPIETPEGANIGLINSLATYSIINKFGFIESPYRKVNDTRITDEVYYIDANKEYTLNICQLDPKIVDGDKITAELVSSRKGGEFVMSASSSVDYVDFSPNQTVSVVASLIPFLENTDVSRALMGSNMQRQAVPLLTSEAPLIGTGMESAVANNTGSVVKAKHRGNVVFSDATKIIVSNDTSLGEKIPALSVYEMRKFTCSNQGTCFNQQPMVSCGDEVIAGQIIAEGPSTKNGELALGKNILLGFVSWNGYNYEDSIIISEKLVAEEVFTSVHIEELEVVARDTRLGAEEITRDIPSASEDSLRHLDESGVVNIGVSVKPGDILVGKATPKAELPITPEERLLRAVFGEKVSEVKDTSLRVPVGVSGVVVDVKILTKRGLQKDQRAKEIEMMEIIKLKDDLATKLSLFDAIISKEADELLNGAKCSSASLKKAKAVPASASDEVKLTAEILSKIDLGNKLKIDPVDYELAQKLEAIRNKRVEFVQNEEKNHKQAVQRVIDGSDLPQSVLKVVKVYIAVKERLQPGDKMAGRHGNKGVVSKIVPVEDMPFMENGRPLDMILNPLGIVARMNIGQIFETHLGAATASLGHRIGEMVKERAAVADLRKSINDFTTDANLKESIAKMSDEDVIEVAKIYSKGIPIATPVFDGATVRDIDGMLTRAGLDTSGQRYLYDGKSGEKIDRKVTVGYMYMMKLHHLVNNKIHARSTGPYSLITQQPLGGKSHFGGQRLGEMECWALQAYGAAYILQEMLTVKSDDVEGRRKMYESIVRGASSFDIGVPESFNVMIKELRALCLDVNLEKLGEGEAIPEQAQAPILLTDEM